MRKAGSDQDAIDKLLDPIDWTGLPDQLQPDLDAIARAAILDALKSIEESITASPDMISAANTVAGDWAHARAAEMVGMHWTADGVLAENPSAHWAISETTRENVRELVAEAFAQETPLSTLATSIEESATFGESRAAMIAKTESAFAANQGNLAGWVQSGVVPEVAVLLSGDHVGPDECDELAEDGPYKIGEAPILPAHPRCECRYKPILTKKTKT